MVGIGWVSGGDAEDVGRVDLLVEERKGACCGGCMCDVPNGDESVSAADGDVTW